jgi:hypothetical protein
MKKIIVLMLALAFVQVNTAMAQKPGVVISNKEGWHKIGEVTASFKMENESILIVGASQFKSIKLKVIDAPINIELLNVYYKSGDVEEIRVKSELKAGEETRSMDVKQKDIKKVQFTYKTMPNSKNEKAHIELWGLK